MLHKDRIKKANMIFSKNSVIPRDSRWEIKNPSAISSDGFCLVADNIRKKNQFRHDFLAVVAFYKWHNSEHSTDW